MIATPAPWSHDDPHSAPGDETTPGCRRDRLRVATARRAVALLAAVGLSISLSAAQAKDPVRTLTYQLAWFHSTEFAGFYVADRHGHYAKAGLDVRFVEAGPETDVIDAVVGGDAQLGSIGAGALIVARSKGLPVRAIVAIQRRSPLVFITLKESGITRPQQFAGESIFVVEQSRPALRAVASKVGLSPDDYDLVDVRHEQQDHDHQLDFGPLLSGEIDVWVGLVFDEALAIQSAAKKAGLSGV